MLKRFQIILASLLVFSLVLNAQTNGSEKFYQDIETDIQLPAEAGKNVIKLFSSNGIFRFKSGIWSGKLTGSNSEHQHLMDKKNLAGFILL